jgi:hypothetical protein
MSRFKLYFSISSTKTSTRVLDRAAGITANAINQGSFFSKLSKRFPHHSTVLVMADDASKLILETSTNVAVEIVDDTSFIRPKSTIYSEITKLLIKDQVLWNSVFWNNDNYRPDRTSETIQDVYESHMTL